MSHYYPSKNWARFTARCNAFMIDGINGKKPKTIETDVFDNWPIESPEWCPKLKGEPRLKALPSPQTTTPKKAYTYSEKREAMKKFPRHIEWDDIKEDGIYVIPKILTQERKVVKILSKTPSLIRCEAIKEYGYDSTYTTIYLYPNDLDAIMLVELRHY